MSVIYHLSKYLRPPWHITPWYTILGGISRSYLGTTEKNIWNLSIKGRNVQQSVISHGGRTPWHNTPWYATRERNIPRGTVISCGTSPSCGISQFPRHITLNMVYHSVICLGGHKYVPKWYITLIPWNDCQSVQTVLNVQGVQIVQSFQG